MNRIYIILVLIFIYQNNSAQLLPYNPDNWDADWTYTKFSEYFTDSTLDLNKWNVDHKPGRN